MMFDKFKKFPKRKLVKETKALSSSLLRRSKLFAVHAGPPLLKFALTLESRVLSPKPLKSTEVASTDAASSFCEEI